MRDFKAAFWRDVDACQAEIAATIQAYFIDVGEDLDLVREENVARESEQDPEFRELVAETVREGWEALEAMRTKVAEQ